MDDKEWQWSIINPVWWWFHFTAAAPDAVCLLKQMIQPLTVAMYIDQLSDFFLHIKIKDHQNLSHRRGRRPYQRSSSESQWSAEKLDLPDIPQIVHYSD